MLISSASSEGLIARNVPKRFRKAKQPVKVDDMTWLKSFYLSGGPGTGKSHNAYAFYIWRIDQALKRVKHGGAVNLPGLRVINVPRMISEGKQMTIEGRQNVIEGLIDVPMLIMDDLGGEYRTDYSEQVIYDIVEGRYIEEKYTGFISNLALGDDLPYEVRILSRIRGIIIDNEGEMTGRDRRLRS